MNIIKDLWLYDQVSSIHNFNYDILTICRILSSWFMLFSMHLISQATWTEHIYIHSKSCEEWGRERKEIERELDSCGEILLICITILSTLSKFYNQE